MGLYDANGPKMTVHEIIAMAKKTASFFPGTVYYVAGWITPLKLFVFRESKLTNVADIVADGGTVIWSSDGAYPK